MEVKLVMFKNDGVRKDFLLQTKRTTLGRGEECGLRIPLLSVSRKHCELIKGEEHLKLRDLGSSNGTYVNNKRVTETELEAGDLLIIGPVIFTVQIDGKPKDIKAVKIQPRKRTEEDREQEEINLEAVAAGGEDDEVIELEADDSAAGALSGAADDADPIDALEALAMEEDEDEKKK